MFSEAFVQRFWHKVEKSADCWLWTAACSTSGYGVIRSPDRAKNLRAHRVSWELRHGGPISAGTMVLHHCNTKTCVNPNHLYLGDYSQNIRDAWRDGLRTLSSGQTDFNRRAYIARMKKSPEERSAARLLAIPPERRSEIARRAYATRRHRQALGTGRT